MEFYYFGGNFTPGFLDSIKKSKFTGVMFTHDVTQGDIFTQIAQQVEPNEKIKYLVAIRPYTISPQYLCMINKSMSEILKGDRLQINFISGYIKDHEKSFGGIIGQVNDQSNKIDKFNYLVKSIDVLNEMEGNKNNPLDFYISMTSPILEKTANKHDSKIILPYRIYKSQFWKAIHDSNGKLIAPQQPLNLNFNKVMLALTPIIRKDKTELEKLPKEYAYRPVWREGEISKQVSDVEFFTYDEFVIFIKNLKEKGITQLLLNAWPIEELETVKHYVNKYYMSEEIK